MNIYQRIRQDHDRHRKLLAAIDRTSGASAERRKLFGELRRDVAAHAAAEEQSFYAALIADPDGQERARHSIAEHEETAGLLDELQALDMASGGWLAKFRKMKDDLEHHMDEEEDEVFANAKALLNGAESQKLAETFERRKTAELKG